VDRRPVRDGAAIYCGVVSPGGSLVEDRTAWFLDGARASSRADDEVFLAQRLRELTAGSNLEERVPLDHVAARLGGLLERAHGLSAGVLDGGLWCRDSARRFDRLFKLL
jgi:hypothetical protein